MAGSIGDIIQVTVTTIYGTVPALNVYYYQITDTPTATYLEGLSTEFQNVVLAAFAATQLTNTIIQSISLRNIFSGDELVDASPTPAAGTRTPTGDQLASFIACAIKLVRANARVRPGRKMLLVSLEGDIAGQFLAAGFVTLAQAYANTLDNNLDAGGIDLFVPTIVGRVLYTTPSGGTAYRLPESQAEMGDVFSPVAGVTVSNRVTTMNSRKFWKGV